MNFKLSQKASLVLPLLFALGLYLQTVRFGYVLDDKAYIVQNRFVQNGLAEIKEIFTTSAWEGYTTEKSNVYRPVMTLSFAAIVQFAGTGPFAQHFFNLLLLLSTIFLLHRLFSGYILSGYNAWTVFFILTLWIVLPLNIETLANIKGRDNLMSLLFCTASALLLKKYNETGSGRYAVLSGLIFLFALLSKEVSIVFFVLIPLLMYFKEESKATILRSIVVLVFPLAVFLVLRWMYASSGAEVSRPENNFILHFKGAERFLFTCYLFLNYFIKLLYPVDLSWDYSEGYFHQGPYLVEGLWGLLSAALLCSVFIHGLYKRKLYGFFSAWFLLSYLPTGNIFFLTGVAMADRFMYVPSLGLISLLATTLNPGAAEGMKQKRVLFLFLLSIYFLFTTVPRIKEWKDEATLITADFNKPKRSFRAEMSMVEEILLKAQETSSIDRDELEKAAGIIHHCLKKYPKILPVYYISIRFWQAVESYPEMLKVARQGLVCFPTDYQLYISAGHACRYSGNASGALEHYGRALQLQPRNSIAYSNLGAFFQQLGDTLKSIQYYKYSLSLTPGEETVQKNLYELLSAYEKRK